MQPDVTTVCSAPGKVVRKEPHPSSRQSQSMPDFTTSVLHKFWLQKNKKQRECLAETVASHPEPDLVWDIWKQDISSAHHLETNKETNAPPTFNISVQPAISGAD